MSTTRAVIASDEQVARVSRAVEAHTLAGVAHESCRDRDTVLRVLARQPIYPASLRSILATCDRLENPNLPQHAA
jgi:hypothetical protein